MGDEQITPVPGFESGGAVGVVALFGGTFDPPHRGHVAVAMRAAERVLGGPAGGGWRLVFVPAARSPHKTLGPLASGADRVDMLRAALEAEGVAGVAGVWTDELDRAAREPGDGGYTIDTARRCRRWLDAHGATATRLRLIIGEDQARALHRWREPAELIALAKPIVLPRDAAALAGDPGFTARRQRLEADLRSAGWGTAEAALIAGSLADVPPLPAAATLTRQRLLSRTEGCPPELHGSVWALIRARGLYTPESK